MPSAADSIRHLTRAYIGAGVYQGLIFWFVLAHNITAVLRDVGGLSPNLRMWLTVGGIVTAATIGTYYRSRFGRVEPPRPPLWRQVARGIAFALLLMGAMSASVFVFLETGASPVDVIWLLVSAGTVTSLAASRGDRGGWVVALLASAGLLATLLVPALRPYRALGHAGMAAALVVTAIQLHLFLVRGLRHAQG